MNRKYLILNLESFLNDSSQKPNYPDLLLKTLKRKKPSYRILSNGFKLSYYLKQLVNEHGYRIVIYGTDQKKQIEMIMNLRRACKENNLADLAEVTEIAVRDSECFMSIKSSKPIIFNYQRHNIKVAGYDQNADGSACALEALSKMLNISEFERKNHIVIDTTSSTIEKAILEGWRAYHIEQNWLIDGLIEIHLQEISDQPLESTQEFEFSDEKVKGGSSPNRGWYIDKVTKNKWFGKSSLDTLNAHYDLLPGYSIYKECLASIFYNLLGVLTPKTTLSYQRLSEKTIKLYEINPDEAGIPKLHLMSQYVDGFKELGLKFIKHYKEYQPRDSYFSVTDKNLPLRGFGRVIAFAILLHDFDCIGNSGGNMGYIVKSEYAEIVKIDAGEALSFADDMSSSKELENSPYNREAIIGTGQCRIRFDELNQEDQKEFVQTIEEILNIPDSHINEVTKRFLSIDGRFDTIRKRLIERKNNLLAAFSPEVKELLIQQMHRIENQKVDHCMKSWDEPLSTSNINDSKEKFIEKFSRLEAIKLLNDSENTIKFQVPTSKEHFIGREEELHRMRDIFQLSNQQVTYIALVGTAGFGKTQLAMEYIIQNQKEYSHIIWLNGEKNVLLLLQIQSYVQVYVNPQKNFESFKSSSDKIRFDPFFKNSLLKEFYQSLSKGNPKKVCLIIDNTENMEDIADYLPTPTIAPMCKLNIILTCRYRNWSGPIEHIINLQTFSIEEIGKCLSTQLHVRASSEEVANLKKLLDGVPIAVTLAIASMKKTNQCISDYCNKILNHHDSEVGEDEECKVFARVMIPTMTDLRNKNTQVKIILDIMAYLSPDHITLSLLQECWRQSSNGKGKKEEEKQFKEGLDLLESYSIISQNNAQSFQNQRKKDESTVFVDKKIEDPKINVHRLTQKVIRSIHNKNQTSINNIERMISRLTMSYNFSEEDFSSVLEMNRKMPHTIYLRELEEMGDTKSLWKAFQPGSSFDFSKNLINIGYYQLSVFGDYDKAKRIYLHSLKIYEHCKGMNDHLWEPLVHLSFVCGLLGQYEEQKKFLTRALEIIEPWIVNYQLLLCLFPQMAKEQLNAFITSRKENGQIIRIGKMGLEILKLLRESNCYSKHKDLLLKMLKMFNYDYCEDNQANFRILLLLGAVWGVLGKIEKQEFFWSRSLQMSQKIYGKNDLITGQNLMLLSSIWGDLKKYEKQKNALNEAIEIFRNKLGNEHPYFGLITTELADAWGLLGDYKKQKDLLIQAMEIFKEAYGDGHIQIGIILKNLADVSGILGDYDTKRESLNKALKISEKYYGKNHPETELILKNLQSCS